MYDSLTNFKKVLKKLDKISGQVISKNSWWEYRKDYYFDPRGVESEYHFVHTPGSVFVLPRLDDGSFVMTHQFRYLNQKISIEFPGGGVKQNLSILDNARAELEEEAGYKASSMILISAFNPFNGVTDELCSVYLATGLKETELKPEPSEEFEIVILKKEEIINKINIGEIWDGMTLAAWSMYYFSNLNT